MTDAIRDAIPQDNVQIASLWHQGWHDAHAAIVPGALTRLRTLDSFRRRAARDIPGTRVSHMDGAVSGFCITRGVELYQLYVSPLARGTGAAQALVKDAERIIQARHAGVAWLSCGIGNERAARFYRKCGWQLTQNVTDHVETDEGRFPLEVWRFEKDLTSL